MKTLAIISHKGGAGKTSSAVMLAEDFARRGLRVVLVDADRHRGAGLLLGIEQASGQVQQTPDPKLRYFCSSGMPLREIPAKAEELAGLFDVAVVDTPSLDDPLAKAWIQLCSQALMVLPVEPISIRTLDGADAALELIARLNPKIEMLGILPTIFDQSDATQRTLMQELRASRPDTLLNATIPLDSGLVHRAEQKSERRTEPSEQTRAAYKLVGDLLLKALRLSATATTDPGWQPTAKSERAVPAAPQPVR
ncbi:MAG TPA: ParA family protein, partial [Armatimonadota bacterium]|nr:ParA family protein [Armatimonadota bacterium]